MKYALIIGNTEYSDPKLARLSAPGRDAEDFANVLRDKNIGAFDDVKILLNKTEPVVREAIDEFFDQKKPDDLLLLYFSGHGIRDEFGSLYLAVKNTSRVRLRATAVKSDFIREVMDQSRSKRQVLILDCCNSGAFPHGTKAITGASIGTSTAFQGYGRIILTASDSTEFAWEGDQIIGETNNSLFTHFLVSGLKGEADLDGDGRITVDELYDYAYDQVKVATPKQNPSKFSSGQQGEIVLRQSINIENIKPISLPDDLIDDIEDTRPILREAAVQRLEKILNGKNLGMARSAKEALEKIIADENTTRRVAQLATQALENRIQVETTASQTKTQTDEAKFDIFSKLKNLVSNFILQWEKLQTYISINSKKNINLLRVGKVLAVFSIIFVLALYLRVLVFNSETNYTKPNVDFAFSTIKHDVPPLIQRKNVFYGVNGEQIFANFNLKTPPLEETEYKVMWYYKLGNNFYLLISKKSYITNPKDRYTAGEFHLEGSLLIVGQYRVEIYENEKLIVSKDFNIKRLTEK